MLREHTKLFYKCTGCPRAFDSKAAIYAHREEMHGDASEKEADFTLIYKAPFLSAAAGNIFGSRESYEARLEAVARRWPRRFGFQCGSCEVVFDTRQELEAHNTSWCQLQTGYGNSEDSTVGPVGSATKLFPTRTESKRVDMEKEFESRLEALREMCPRKCDNCSEMLSMLRAHFGSHSGDKTEEPPSETAPRGEDVQGVDVSAQMAGSSKKLRRRTQRSELEKDARDEAQQTPVENKPAKRTTRSKVNSDSNATVKNASQPNVEDVLSKAVGARRASSTSDIRAEENTPSPVIKTEPPTFPSPSRSTSSPQPAASSASNAGAKVKGLAPSTKGKNSPKPAQAGSMPFLESLGKDVPSQVRMN